MTFDDISRFNQRLHKKSSAYHTNIGGDAFLIIDSVNKIAISCRQKIPKTFFYCNPNCYSSSRSLISIYVLVYHP